MKYALTPYQFVALAVNEHRNTHGGLRPKEIWLHPAHFSALANESDQDGQFVIQYDGSNPHFLGIPLLENKRVREPFLVTVINTVVFL